MSVAMPVTRLEACEIFSSATAWVLRCSERPSFTRASNTLLPSSCALAKAPRPASQICWAESLTVLESWAPGFFLSLLSFCSFLTIRPPWKGLKMRRSNRAGHEWECTPCNGPRVGGRSYKHRGWGLAMDLVGSIAAG